jgi:ABC-2 type transport system permease protein
MSSRSFAKVLVVAKDEWRYWLRSKLAISVLVIGLLLTLSSVIVTAVTMMELSHSRSSLQDTAEQAFVDQPDRHPHRMVHYGHYAFRVPSPLSTIDPGVDAFTGNSIFLEGHRQNSAMFADQKQGTALTSLGSLSPAFILQVLAPLLLILIAYSSVSRERESQTLSFIVSQGTSIFTLIIGKGLALLCVVGLIMLPLIASSGIAIMQGESIVVVLSFLSAYILYLLVWSLVVLLVSTAVSKNSESFTALLFVWILFCIVMPRIASSTASASIVSPGKLETDFAVIAELRKLGDGHNANDPAFSQLKASLLRQYSVQTVEELPINFRGAVARASEAQLTEVLNRFAENSMQEELAQTQLARSFGWLSPMVAIRSLSMISAGTSIETHHRFMREAEDLRFSFVQSLNQVHVNKLNYADDMNRNANAEAGQKARVSAENWQMIQDFEFQLESASARLQRSLPAFAQLFMWIAIAGALIRFFGRRAV